MFQKILAAVVLGIQLCLLGCATPKSVYLQDRITGRIFGPLPLTTGKDFRLGPVAFSTQRKMAPGTYRRVEPTQEEILFHRLLELKIPKTYQVEADIESSIHDIRTKFIKVAQVHCTSPSNAVRFEIDLTDYEYEYGPNPKADHGDTPPRSRVVRRPPLIHLATRNWSLWDLINIVAKETKLKPVIRGRTIVLTQRDLAPLRIGEKESEGVEQQH